MATPGVIAVVLRSPELAPNGSSSRPLHFSNAYFKLLTIQLSILMYGAEAWTLTATKERLLDAFDQLATSLKTNPISPISRVNSPSQGHKIGGISTDLNPEPLGYVTHTIASHKAPSHTAPSNTAPSHTAHSHTVPSHIASSLSTNNPYC